MVDKTGSDFAITNTSLYGNASDPTFSGVMSFMRRKFTKEFRPDLAPR